MRFLVLAILTLIASANAHADKLHPTAHGVERGSVNFENAGKGLSSELKDRIDLILRERCSIEAGASLRVTKVAERIEEIDRGILDYFYTVEVEARGPRGIDRIVLEIAEYAISNPDTDNIELLSILPEGLCN